MNKRELIVAILSATLGFSGAVGSSFLTSWIAQNNWEKQLEINTQNEIVRTRIKLIEDVIDLRIEMQRYQVLFTRLEGQFKIFELLSECQELSFKLGKEKSECSSKEFNLEKIMDGMLKAEKKFSKTVFMSSHFFGPNTRKEIDAFDLNHDLWFQSFHSSSARVLDAMYSEVYWLPSEK